MTMKNLTYGLVSLAALCAVLLVTPLGVTAQQTIRNITGVITFDGAQPVTISSGTVTVDAGTGFAIDATHGATVNEDGPGVLIEGKDFDGAALPNAVTEGQAVRSAGTLRGIQYVMVVNEDGSLERGTTTTPLAVNVVQANSLSLDPCEANAHSTAVVDIVTATTTEIIAADATKKTYICGMTLFTAGINNVALVEDDTAACASPATNGAGMMGGYTAAEGFNFVANQGFVLPAGKTAHAVTASTNRYVCLITSGAVQLSGVVKWVQQ